jgi:hypothetical protein
MGKYYFLIAGLPSVAFEGGKPPYTVPEFKNKLAEHATKADMRLFDLLQLKTDTKNLLEQLQNPDYELTEGGKVTGDEIRALISGVKAEFDSIKAYEAYNEKYRQEKEEEQNKDYYDRYYHKIRKLKIKIKTFKNKNKRLPAYFEAFTRIYLTSVDNGDAITVPWEDRLSAMYYEYAMKRSNSFLSSWFELNLNINNIYTALTCRKYKLDRALYIVGNTATSNKLRSSTVRDFELGETLAYFTSVSRIAEDPDILQRELRTDQLKWEWLDETIFPQVFGVENVITYWLKLEMLERWSSLDKAVGEKAFRQIVGAMKKSSSHVLEEFKRNNKK